MINSLRDGREVPKPMDSFFCSLAGVCLHSTDRRRARTHDGEYFAKLKFFSPFEWCAFEYQIAIILISIISYTLYRRGWLWSQCFTHSFAFFPFVFDGGHLGIQCSLFICQALHMKENGVPLFFDAKSIKEIKIKIIIQCVCPPVRARSCVCATIALLSAANRSNQKQHGNKNKFCDPLFHKFVFLSFVCTHYSLSFFALLLAIAQCCDHKWNTPLSSFCSKFAKSISENKNKTKKERKQNVC